MQEVTFNVTWLEFLLEHRSVAATAFLQLFTFVGNLEGYIFVVVLIHVAYDKDLAFRLAALVLVTMCLNHLLKTLIANPRPFVTEGTYAHKWAVWGNDAAKLLPEYSTPSGHAMAGSSFYAYLCAQVKQPLVRVLAIATIILMGLSRPYLGVHYVEDVLLGWALGIPIALLAVRFGDRLASLWKRRSLVQRGLVLVLASVATLAVTHSLYAGSAHGQPSLFTSYLGLLTGIVIAHPLEARWVSFQPRSSTSVRKMIRVALSLGLVLGTLALLDGLFARLADDTSLLGMLLRYVRYAAAAIVGMLVAPLLFVRLRLAMQGREP